MVQVYCKNTGTTLQVQEGTPLVDLVDKFEFDKPLDIVSAKVNNVSQGLKYRVFQSRDVEFVDIREASGMRVYIRSLCFLLCKAVHDVTRGSRVYMESPIANGYFINLKKFDKSAVTPEDVAMVKARMQEIVDENIAFRMHESRSEDALKLFRELGTDDKVKLLDTTGVCYLDYYTLENYVDFYYGRLVPSAGYLKVWDLQPYEDGMLLRFPCSAEPTKVLDFVDQPKTYKMFSEALRWNIIMGMNSVGDVNQACNRGHASELIQVAEALQDKKIVAIAEEINNRYHDSETPIKIVLITGPSSSGKSTFCRKLSVQLKACGLRPISFSTDDYFVNRVDTPKLPDGSYDFDNFSALDIELLQKDVERIVAGERVEVPEYNFATGLREYNGKTIRLTKGAVLIIEGIHALNPQLVPNIPDAEKFKIFINTITATKLDNHNFIPTDDNRLIRRILRDYYRGAFSPAETIRQWPKVIAAEKKWILPYQETADVMFNSAYLLEFAVIKNHAETVLRSVPKNAPEYSESHRLITFLNYFVPVSDKEIPATSMLREFLG